ncbi:MAG: ASKHA domain-containing protein [Lachnospiraceae bacterium]|nr:ASKHA domain-containing protein [Lachnospiraceae bacterium]
MEREDVEIKWNKERVIKGKKGRRLLDTLRDNGVFISAPCGGNGTCGKCRVNVDGESFLACDYILERDIEAFPELSEENMQAVSAEYESKADIRLPGLAIDLGTTTIALAVVDISDGRIVGSESCINHQRSFGADVISRIDAAVSGRAMLLRSTVQKDILNEAGLLMEKTGSGLGTLKKIVISGNTTMLQLLMGWPADGLAAYPFSPFRIEGGIFSFNEVFNSSESDAEVMILPGVSAFVGADIVSGAENTGIAKSESMRALIDLGTNGEMVVGNSEKLWVTSTAAGPAFEGGNLRYGMPGVSGAISHVNFENGKCAVQTIGGGEAKGICGSGLVEAVYELRKNDIIDRNGIFADEYSKGYPLSFGARDIYITQGDIQEFLLAKAAIRTGFEILLMKAGLKAEELADIYIAGGFGFFLDLEKAAGIGLLPAELKKKMKAVGNSSLKGAVDALSSWPAAEFGETAAKAESFELAEISEFNERYIENMRLDISE